MWHISFQRKRCSTAQLVQLGDVYLCQAHKSLSDGFVMTKENWPSRTDTLFLLVSQQRNVIPLTFRIKWTMDVRPLVSYRNLVFVSLDREHPVDLLSLQWFPSFRERVALLLIAKRYHLYPSVADRIAAALDLPPPQFQIVW